MANSSHTAHRGGGPQQAQQPELEQRLKEMPMNRYIYPIPRCQGCAGDCRQLRELLECQIRLLGEILAVLDEMAEKQST